MEASEKKVYNKPGIVFCDFKTGEMTGSEWMIEKIVRENEDARKAQGGFVECPFEDMGPPCQIRNT